MDSKDGKLSCVGGIGDKTPSSGSEDNLDSMSPENVARSEDNAGRSSVGPVSQGPGKEHDVDGAPPKKTKSTECYIEHRSESLIKSIRNERIAMTREQEEVIELLQLVEEDGVPNGSALYFIATELFRSPARRASYRSITAAENRIAWLKWTWENVKT
ncbi:hypothetical protein HU200_018389 [Digitaria exilis]|uniref:Uncharacterized protein n=1 Tax=Digitaria exilis TaxID=1010633 RepID=A0A835F3Y9_9POAL|nr:hypothetical protein HU200_018389 [Digitaria exilis]